MDDSQNMDESLATLSDDVITRKSLIISSGTEDYQTLIEDLNNWIGGPAVPSEEFQDRLTNRLTTEWAAGKRAPTRPKNVGSYQLLLTAACLGVALMAGALLLSASAGTQASLSATALGVIEAGLFGLGAVILGTGMLLFWRSRR